MQSMLPEDPESYVHIAGRTGRAGGRGRAVCVFTRREMDRAGWITKALQHVKWRVRRDEFRGDGHADDAYEDARDDFFAFSEEYDEEYEE